MGMITGSINLLKECFKECTGSFVKYKKQFFILLSIYIVAFSSIFRANFAYWDDIGRTYAGYHGWLDWSRYGTELLATLVQMDWHLTDLSPLPQLLACAIMAAAGILLLDVFSDGGKIEIFQIIAASLTALAPYFLGIISYKFDSPYMAVSFLVCVFPFLFRRKPRSVYAIISCVCLIAMCVTYQASSGVYPVIVLFLSMNGILKGESIRENIKFIGVSSLCYLASLGFFWLFLMRENGVSIPLSVLPAFAADRYIAYYKIIFHDCTKVWLVLLAAVIIVFLCSVYQSAGINRGPAVCIGIFMIFAGSILCFGVNLFLSREAYDTRIMYGINFLITMLAVFISFHAKGWMYQVVYVLLAWSFAVFALTYGNALAVQKDYMNHRVELLAADVSDLDIMNTDSKKYIRMAGDIGYSPVIRNMAENYPILERESYIGSGDGLFCSGLAEGIWGEYYFFHYLNIPNIESTPDMDDYQDWPVVRDTIYHTIRENGNCIVIELKE